MEKTLDSKEFETYLKKLSILTCSKMFEDDKFLNHLIHSLQLLPSLPSSTLLSSKSCPSTPICEKCKKGPMCREKATNMFGFRYRCNYRVVDAVGKHRKCHYQKSPLAGTWFDNCKLPIGDVLKIVLLFVSKIPVIEASKLLGRSRSTVIEWYAFCRNVCQNWINKKTTDDNGFSAKIGGPGKTVEVDEAHLCTRKFHRGRILESQQYWIFGAHCRESKDCFYVRVARRNKDTLLPIMKNRIHHESEIISDAAKVYQGCDRMGLFKSHKAVNHKKHFVSPQSKDVHTNNIERGWRSLKATIKSFREEHIDSYISEHLYRKKFLEVDLKAGKYGEAFRTFLTHVAILYRPQS